ncbi:hypothetical protein Tco_0462922 [Tanacetum coccineum]
MGSITSIKCVLTQEHLDAICAKYFVSEEVHPQLPSSDATMHERPTGKVGMYTRFFDYANYRIPFSNFFVSVLTHFRIPFSQLSVFGSAKVSHFEILCRVCNINPSVGLFRYFYMHSYKNGWFGFTKRSALCTVWLVLLGQEFVKDQAPTIYEYNVDHASTFIAQASLFLSPPQKEYEMKTLLLFVGFVKFFVVVRRWESEIGCSCCRPATATNNHLRRHHHYKLKINDTTTTNFTVHKFGMGCFKSLAAENVVREHLDAICAKYVVSEEVHPQLPSFDATMHERPTGKVGMYTRFFDYVNYRIPFSNFFVSVLTHFRIPFSQLSVFSYKNGWFGFTKRLNVRTCYSKNLNSMKNWNDHFFWVDEFIVPANARFGWFSGTNIVKDRAPTISEYNVDHASTLIAQASSFLRFLEEFLCWVGISRNYLLNKDTYPLFEYEDEEEMDLNAFIRTADPRKVRVVERARTENEKPIVTVAKHRTVTLLSTSVPRSSGELSASIEREFVENAGGSGGGDQEVASVGGHGNIEPIVPIMDNIVAETEASGPKRSKKKRVTRGSESTPAASHPPKRLRADYGKTGGSAAGGKSPSVLNRLLQDSRLMVEQGVPALPTLPFITSSVTASPLEEGGDHTDSVTGPSLRTVGPSARFVVLSDSSHHSGAKSADPEVDSFVRSVAPVMTAATTVTAFVSNAATTTATPVDVGKDKDVPTPSVFVGSDKTDRTLSLFTGRSGSDFVAGSIRAGGAADVDLQEIYIPEWSVTKGFELNDGRSCANMIDHFTPPAFFKTVRGMEHEQLFAEFNVSAARNLSLSSEVRMRAEYNILEKRKWKSLAEEKNNLLQVKDKEIEELRSQLLHLWR